MHQTTLLSVAVLCLLASLVEARNPKTVSDYLKEAHSLEYINQEELDVAKLFGAKRRVLVIIDVQKCFVDERAPGDTSSPTANLAVTTSDIIIGPIRRLMQHRWDMIVITKDHHPKNHCSFSASCRVKSTEDPSKQQKWLKHCVQGLGPEDPNSPELIDELHNLVEDSKRGAGVRVQNFKVPGDYMAHGQYWTRSDGTIMLVSYKGENPDVDSYSAFADGEGQTTGLSEQIFDLLGDYAEYEIFVTGIATDFCVVRSAEDADDQFLGKVTLVTDAMKGVFLDFDKRGVVQIKRAASAILMAGGLDETTAFNIMDGMHANFNNLMRKFNRAQSTNM